MLIAVGIGAFGAHGLAAILIENGRVETFDVASRYHFYHALSLVLVAVLIDRGLLKKYAATVVSLMVVGIVLFSGSLYILSVTNLRWLGAIAPLGGGAFMLAWGLVLKSVSAAHSG